LLPLDLGPTFESLGPGTRVEAAGDHLLLDLGVSRSKGGSSASLTPVLSNNDHGASLGRAMTRPNILLIMTDQERYPPAYETEELAAFRRTQLPARERLRAAGLELHRHYAGSTACLPSRATLFTGHYPSLHGVTKTDGLAKPHNDPDMCWLDPAGVPTLGDWFRAGGYRTHYRGKWHISYADLPTPGSHEGLKASDDSGAVIPAGVEAYQKADPLDPFGFSGWIGREPHGAAKADSGTVRDGVYADQVAELFAELSTEGSEQPWLAVASLVNPHDISFAGGLYEKLLGFNGFDDTVPSIEEPPSQTDSFAGRPACQEQFKDTWPQMVSPQPTDVAYRRLYYYLHKVVDQAIGQILDALEASGLAENTIIVFTSDHGELLGAHGGLQQKWCNAFDEAIRVPLLVCGPGIVPVTGGINIPTSHVDLLPTLLGLAGIDVNEAATIIQTTHYEVHPLPGRDLSLLLAGQALETEMVRPVYFMTEDDVSHGSHQINLFSGLPYEAIQQPSNIESVITTLSSGPGGADEIWKLNRYYEQYDKERAQMPPVDGSTFELHNLSTDPEERCNLAGEAAEMLEQLHALLVSEGQSKRRQPHNLRPVSMAP
jgi:arylsulfatase A-like enzyme